MERQSDPAFTTEDTIVAIILSMRALGLNILLSPDFQQQDGTHAQSFKPSLLTLNFSFLVESLLSRIDTIIHQRAGPINLEYGSVAATFQKTCDMVSSARAKHRAGAHLEAAAMATYDQRQDETEAGPSVTAKGVSEADFEETILAHEAADRTIWTYDWDCDDCDNYKEYNSDDDQCGCHSAFGKDDDGEVRHEGLNCQYRF
jgi:hypothetical protein